MLELITVFVVLGLISAIGMISVLGHLDQSELIRVSQLVANADRKEREASRQSPLPGGLIVERSMQRLRYKSSARTIDLGRNVKISELIISLPSSGDGTILFSQSGQSATYAFRLESRRGALNWVLIVGLTGQVLFIDNSDEVRSLLAMGG